MNSDERRYITKKEAVVICNRGERSLERDISDAMRLNDVEYLSHARIRLANGTVVPGTEVTPEKIAEWKQDKLVPTWEYDEYTLIEKHGRRGEERPASNQAASNAENSSATDETDTYADTSEREFQGDSTSTTTRPEIPTEPEKRALVVEHLYFAQIDHDKVVQELTQELVEITKANQVLQKQTNELHERLVPKNDTPGETTSPKPKQLKQSAGFEGKAPGVLDASTASSSTDPEKRQREAPKHQKSPDSTREKSGAESDKTKEDVNAKKTKPTSQPQKQTKKKAQPSKKKKATSKPKADQPKIAKSTSKKKKPAAKKDLFPTVTAIKNFFSGGNE